MSTDLILSNDRCFEQMYPSATENAPCMAVLLLDERTLPVLPTGQRQLKLPERGYHRKKKIPLKAETGHSTR